VPSRLAAGGCVVAGFGSLLVGLLADGSVFVGFGLVALVRLIAVNRLGLVFGFPARVFGLLGFVRLFAALVRLLTEDRDAFADCDRRPFLDQEAADDAGVIGFEVHSRFVGLDLAEDVALRDFVTDLHVPPGDDAFLHRIGQAGH